MTFGKYLKYKRKINKLTQQQLADKLNISDKTISKWENDICEPDIDNVKKLSIILNVSVFELINHKDLNNYSKHDLNKINSYKEITNNKIVNYLIIVLLIISLSFNIYYYINRKSDLYIIQNHNIKGYLLTGDSNILHINSIILDKEINDIDTYKVEIMQDNQSVYNYLGNNQDNKLYTFLSRLNIDVNLSNNNKNIKIIINYNDDIDNKIMYDLSLKKN